MPIVPYQYGGGQVPLHNFLPQSISSSSNPSVILPDPPSAGGKPVPTPESIPPDAPDASESSPTLTIDIPPSLLADEISSKPSPSSTASSVGGCPNSLEDPMKVRKGPLAVIGSFVGLCTFSGLYQNVLFSKITPVSERAEESQWVASSNSWLDRKACNWFGICGWAHLDKSRWTEAHAKDTHRTQQYPLESGPGDVKQPSPNDFWTSGKSDPEKWSEEESKLREIPRFVLNYAPYVHLYSEEEFWPCDIADHLIHTTPHLNYTPLQASSDHPKLSNLDELNQWGRFVYLQSDDNVEERPEWLGGETNIPNPPEDSEPPDDSDDEDTFRKAKRLEDHWRAQGKSVRGGRSDAPAVLIVVDKGDGVLDAFWFFFYSYNLGNKVFNVRFGNHVGDWEHTVVRFRHGEPKEVWLSEHSFGQTYTYGAVEKLGQRPVVYSATGTHAMYGTAGTQPYILPGGILHDVTDGGPLWDPSLNVHSYTYDHVNDTLRSSNLTPHAPTEWFYFIGHWGDKFYPLSDPRQYRFVGQYHYVNGPLGPRFKNLGRAELCQGDAPCEPKTYMGTRRLRRLRRFAEVGEGEEMSENDVRRFVGPQGDAL